MDWLDLLEVHGTLKSLLQHHRSKASILLHSALVTQTRLLTQSLRQHTKGINLALKEPERNT